MSEKIYTDCKGKNPISEKALKSMILEGTFLTAWYAVSVYVLDMIISPFQMTLMKHRVNNSKTLIMAGRGFGKSMLLTESYITTHLLRDPEIAIALITKTQDLSKKFVGKIKRQFEKKGKVFEIFGDLRDTSEWSKEQFNLKRTGNRPENTVTSSSIGSSGGIVGGHYDILLIDDIVDTSNSRSKKIRDDMMKNLDNSFFPAMNMFSDYQFIHIIGTHYHPDDIYTRLESRDNFKTLKVPALYEGDDGKLRCIWDEIDSESLQMILDVKNNNPLAYEQQYQLKVRKGDGGIFNPEWFQYFSKLVRDDTGVYAYINNSSKSEEEDVPVIESKIKLDLYAGVDLAITKNTNSDYFVFAVIGVDKDKNIYLLDFDRGRYSFSQQLETLSRMGNKWPELIRIGVESVAYQQALLQEASRTTDLPVIKLKTSSDKISRLNSFSALFENSKVFTYSHMRGAGDLESEFLEFPDGEHDDIPDAFCMAWEVQKKNVKKRLIIGPKF